MNWHLLTDRTQTVRRSRESARHPLAATEMQIRTTLGFPAIPTERRVMEAMMAGEARAYTQMADGGCPGCPNGASVEISTKAPQQGDGTAA